MHTATADPIADLRALLAAPPPGQTDITDIKKSQSALDILDAAPAAKSAKKSDLPRVALPPAAAGAVTRFIALHRQLTDLDAQKAAAKADIVAAAEPARRQLCQAGAFHPSVRLHPSLIYTAANRYSAIPAAEEPSLKSTFGDDFTLYFTLDRQLALDIPKLTASADPDVKKALSVLVSSGIATVKRTYIPTERYHQQLAREDLLYAAACSLQILPTATLTLKEEKE